jgi:membrane protease YdiL (CAAX protease family)
MSAVQPPNEPPPWSGRDIVIVLLLILVFWPALTLEILKTSGLATRLYGPDAATESTGGGEAVEDPLLRTRLNLWVYVLAFPLQAATVPVVFYILSGVPVARLGLTRHRLGRNVLSGVGAWLLITPIVFGINIVVTVLCNRLASGSVQEHALTRLARGNATGAEWALIVISAVIVAPVLEETVFRGVLQPWFAGLRNGGTAAMIAAFGCAVLMRSSQIAESFQHRGAGLLTALMPAFFVLALVPFYASVARRPPRPDSPAIFGTALLFASFHASVWPTPVALFVLGLALGMLAARNKSLVGPMVLHGLFNALTCALLAAGWE